METIQVMLIEDQASARDAVAKYLRYIAHFNVQAFEDGQHALEDLARRGNEYHIVLLDWFLGSSTDGDAVLKEIKTKYSHLSVIVFTGQTDEIGPEAIGGGADKYMRKPVDMPELVAAIRNLVEQDAALHNIATAVREILSSDMCFVWLRERRKQQFRLAAWKGNDALTEDEKKTTITMDDDCIQELLARGEPVYVRDLASIQYGCQPELAGKYGWHSLMTIPIIHRGRIMGLLSSYAKQKAQFDGGREHHVKTMLRHFAAQIAEALHNTALFKQSKALNEINNLIAGASDLNQVLDLIVKKGCELAAADAGWLYLKAPEKDELRLDITVDIEGRNVPEVLDFSSSIVGKAAEEGQTFTIADTLNSSLDPLPVAGIRSQIAVPLRHEEQSVGVLMLGSQFSDAFSDNDITLLSSLADLATLAAHQRSLVMNLEHLVKSGQITSDQIFDEAAALKQFVNQVRELTGAPCAAIYPYDPEKKQFYDKEYVVTSGLSGDKKDITDKPRQKGLAVIVRDIEQIVVNDLDDGDIGAIDFSKLTEKLDRERLLEFIRKEKFIVREGVKAFVGISLRATGYQRENGQQEEVGILYVNYRTPHRFTATELHLIQLFAQQVANLIRAARLWSRLKEEHKYSRQQAAVFQKIINAIGSGVDPLPLVLKQATELFKAQSGSFAFVDPDAGQLLFQVTLDDNGRLSAREQIAEDRQAQSWDKGITGHVARTGRSYRTGNVAKVKFYECWYKTTVSELAVPLKTVKRRPLLC